MARPGIVRADTIDLQNQTSPSTQDHTRKAHGSAIGAHHAAELRHVQEERIDEEETLSSAWQAANGLSDEPPSDDEGANVRDGQNAQQNGSRRDDLDAANGEQDDLDDDMMDKISSSPSISDGGYSTFPTTTSPAPCYPHGLSTFHTSTPPHPFRQCTGSPNMATSAASSPFGTTPEPFPLASATPRAASPFPFLSGLIRKSRRPSTPITPVDVETDSSSPFVDSPAHLPLNYSFSNHSSSKVQSESLHQSRTSMPDYEAHDGEIGKISGTGNGDEGYFEEAPELVEVDHDEGNKVQHASVAVLLQESGEICRQPNLVKSASDIEFEAQLLPVDDPLLDDVFSAARKGVGRGIADDDDAWETESDTAHSQDSFESAAYRGDDVTEDLELSAGNRFIDSGWGGECLRETEDIDFEFVYALHTFVATVEGQANAQKGDTMVLLDDSNSYWWLVRVVKDSTIGYLPAEHIETPTERLARLNKHRNVDLSQTMLGDNTEKSKNPLKKAMRRRNAKTVAFAAPTYIEPSEYEYSTDEDSDDDMSLTNGSNDQIEQTSEQSTESLEDDEKANVAPLKIREKKRDASPEKKASDAQTEEDRRRTIDESRASDEQFDRDYNAQKQSRNGTVRNTDSFFRDESIETRKITLTPNILRDDSGTAPTSAKTSLDRGPSLELLKEDPKPSKADKKKQKKSGLLGGIFKKKEKKAKGDENGSIKSKLSGETLRDSPSSEEASPIDGPSTMDNAIQRTGSKGKLQKSPPNTSSLGNSSPVAITPTKKLSVDTTSTSAQSTLHSDSPISDASTEKQQTGLRARAESLTNKLPAVLTPASQNETKPLKIKRAKNREALDVESSPDDDDARNPFANPEMASQAEGRLNVPPGLAKLGAMGLTERLSDSPVHITKADAISEEHEPPALIGDTSSSSADELTSLRSSPSPPMGSVTTDTPTSQVQHQLNLSPQPAHDSPGFSSQISTDKQAPPAPTRTPPPQPGTSPSIHQRNQSPTRNGSTSTTLSTLSPSTGSTPAWSDAHLRAYMDDSSDIKDLLVVVHDTTGALPVSSDHPLMHNLFAEERGKVKELDTALDSMLSQWLAKKRTAARANAPATGSKLPMPAP